VKKDLTEFVARLKLLLIAMVLIVGSYWVALYILTPNPYPRTIVRLHNEDIITADGIRSDGSLTECKSGNKRHIVGDFVTITNATEPIVCVNELRYKDWVKEQQQTNRH
jgi:hypothetical protein